MVRAERLSAKDTVPGPLTFLHVGVTVPGAAGTPFSETWPSRFAVEGMVMVWSGPASADGPPLPSHATSMWSRGAPVRAPSKDFAVRWPDPVTIRVSDRLVQPGRSTISWITLARSGVRCARPTAPTVPQGAGDQLTKASVLGRDEMFPGAVVNAAALSASWP